VLNRLEQLLKEKPFPEPIRPEDVESCGLALGPDLKVSSDLSPVEVARLYLGALREREPNYSLVVLVAYVSLMSRLCRSYLTRGVAGRIFADTFQMLLGKALKVAAVLGFEGLQILKPYWIDVDAYPDLESEKQEQEPSEDAILREIAQELVGHIDSIWSQILGLPST
jgi:hypothetical protein